MIFLVSHLGIANIFWHLYHKLGTPAAQRNPMFLNWVRIRKNQTVISIYISGEEVKNNHLVQVKNFGLIRFNF